MMNSGQVHHLFRCSMSAVTQSYKSDDFSESYRAEDTGRIPHYSQLRTDLFRTHELSAGLCKIQMTWSKGTSSSQLMYPTLRSCIASKVLGIEGALSVHGEEPQSGAQGWTSRTQRT